MDTESKIEAEGEGEATTAPTAETENAGAEDAAAAATEDAPVAAATEDAPVAAATEDAAAAAETESKDAAEELNAASTAAAHENTEAESKDAAEELNAASTEAAAEAQDAASAATVTGDLESKDDEADSAPPEAESKDAVAEELAAASAQAKDEEDATDSAALMAGEKKLFGIGDPVEAQYAGKEKWLPGKITKKNPGGSYNIKYANGAAEENVAPGLIRKFDPAQKKKESAATSVAAKPVYGVGDKIEARYEGGEEYFDGVITRVRASGTYDIRYSDGDTEQDVKAEFIRKDREGVGGGKQKKKYAVGDSVEARYEAGEEWFDATVTKVHGNDTYDLRYADGDEEQDVDASLLRKDREGAGSNKTKKTYRRRDKVEARYEGGPDWFNAEVIKVHGNDTYDLRYEDGDLEQNVHSAMMRKDREDGGSGKTKKVYTVGDSVEARYEGGEEWYDAEITKVHGNDTYNLKYADGDHEQDVKSEFIRKDREGGGGGKQKKKYAVGDSVEARFEGGDEWYDATVTKVHGNDTYNLKYADGDVEDDVKSEFIRKDREGGGGGKQKRVYKKGEKIEARFEGGDEYFDGKITRVNANGTYNIKYSDGDTEQDVPSELIRADREGAGGGKKKKVYAVGEKIEARFEGGEEFFDGTIIAVNSGDPATYDIRYDDGDEEQMVKGEYIRSDREGGGGKERRTYNVGDRIEARFEQGDEYFDGKITKKNADGTYDIRYDDGDREQDVASEFIRPDREGVGGGKKKKVYAVGDRVEALFEQGEDWFDGKVIFVHEDDGTYDIRYDDGDKETRVSSEFIRKDREGVGSGKAAAGRRRRVKAVTAKLLQVFKDAIRRGAFESYRDIFNHADKNKSGKVSRSEFREILRMIDFRLTDEEEAELFEEFKLAKDRIKVKAFLEFCGVTKRAEADVKRLSKLARTLRKTFKKVIMDGDADNLAQVFAVFDPKGRMSVTPDEFKQGLDEFGLRLSSKDLNTLVRLFDRNGDGTVDYDEFVTFCDPVQYAAGARAMAVRRLPVYDQIRLGLQELAVAGGDRMDLAGLFSRFDTAGAGSVRWKTFAVAAAEMTGVTITEKDKDDLRLQVELLRNGHLSYLGFCRFVTAELAVPLEPGLTKHGQAGGVLSSSKRGGDSVTGAYRDWTQGGAEEDMPVAPVGSLGHWLEQVASRRERNNFFKLMEFLQQMETANGLQQRRQAGINNLDDMITIQLGSKLKCGLRFYLG